MEAETRIWEFFILWDKVSIIWRNSWDYYKWKSKREIELSEILDYINQIEVSKDDIEKAILKERLNSLVYLFIKRKSNFPEVSDNIYKWIMERFTNTESSLMDTFFTLLKLSKFS